MSPVALGVAAFGAAISGFTALSLAMDRHYEDAYGRGREPGRWRPWLRVAGSLGVLLSLFACLAIEGPAQGWVLWLGVLTAGALAVVLLQTYAPRRALAAGLACAALGMLAAGVGSALA